MKVHKVTCDSGTIPKVSIGLPVYNGEEFIVNCLTSLLSQSFKDIEIIISDNHSSDETPQIIEAYINQDKRIKFYRQGKNIGGTENFQFVLEKARGEYFMWAAHDDMWNSDYITHLAKLLDTYNDAIVAVGSIHNVFPDSYKYIELDIAVQNIHKCRLMRVIKASFDECYSIYGLWRKKDLMELMPFSGPYWADLPFLMSASYLGKIRQDKRAGFYYRKIQKQLKERLALLNYKNIYINESELMFDCMQRTLRSLRHVNASKIFSVTGALLVGMRLYGAYVLRNIGLRAPVLKKIKRKLLKPQKA